MSRPWGAAIAVLILIATLCPSASYHASAAFPSVASGGLMKMQVSSGDKAPLAPSRGPTIDESDNGGSARAARGQVLVVRLGETDPGQAWQFAGGDRFTVVSEASSPGQHVFRVKVRGPGELSFAKVDRLSKWTVERFTVRVVVDDKAADDETGLNPLSGLAARLLHLLPSYPWRPPQ